MTREDFLYALENAWLITCVREDNKIDVEQTIESRDFETWCRTIHWERLSCKVIYEIIEELWGFED